MEMKKKVSIFLTYDSLDVRPLEGGQPQVSDLDQASCPVDEDVVALEITMDDGRGPGVEEVQALEDLPTPVANHLGLDGLQPPHVPNKGGVAGGRWC